MPANTTNGLPYPLGSDPMGDIDDAVQDLAQELDDQVLAAWEAFTPTLTSSGTTPNLGATGTAVGRKRHRGRSVDYRVMFTFGGAGVSAGTGNYNIGLDPVMVSAGAGDMSNHVVGAAVLLDSSVGATGRFAGTVFVQTASAPTVRIALGGSGGGIVAASAPFAWATGDIIAIAGTYEAPFAP